MLQSMRNLAHSWVVKGLMLFLVVSFCLWGIGDIFRGNPLRSRVARAGSADISVQDLNRAFEDTLSRARRGQDSELTARQAMQMGLLDDTLNAEIKRALIDQDIQRLGIDVAPQAVLKTLAEQPQFRAKDGSFNKELFHQLLEQQGLNERSFITQGQQDLSRQLLLAALSGSHAAPQSEIDALYKARAQKRVLDVVTIDPAKIGGIAAPDDQTLRDFYDHNQAMFTAPEYRGLTIAELSTDALAKDMPVSDDAVRKEYAAKRDQLANPEQRDIVQVVTQDEAKAKSLAQQARTVGDLTIAAKVAGETAVPLDKMEQKNLLPELAKTVFALPQGQIGDPVKTQLGWHVVQVTKIIPAGTPDFDAVKDRLREDMQRDQAIEAATRAVNSLDDELAAGHSLDDIADGLKLRLIKIPAIDATGLTPQGKEPVELPNRAQTLKDGFGQNVGDNSPVEDDKQGNYYVTHTDLVTPAAVSPFDSVKDKVAEAWKAQQQLAKAKTEAVAIAKSLSEGKPLSSFADDQGVTTRVSDPISQLGDSDPLLPPTLVTQALGMKKGQTATAASDRRQVVVRLASIADADPDAKDPRRNRIVGDIKQSASGELLDQYIAHLYEVFPVSIDSEKVDQIRQQDN